MDLRVWPLLFAGRGKRIIATFCIFYSLYDKKKIVLSSEYDTDAG